MIATAWDAEPFVNPGVSRVCGGRFQLTDLGGLGFTGGGLPMGGRRARGLPTTADGHSGGLSRCLCAAEPLEAGSSRPAAAENTERRRRRQADGRAGRHEDRRRPRPAAVDGNRSTRGRRGDRGQRVRAAVGRLIGST